MLLHKHGGRHGLPHVVGLFITVGSTLDVPLVYFLILRQCQG